MTVVLLDERNLSLGRAMQNYESYDGVFESASVAEI